MILLILYLHNLLFFINADTSVHILSEQYGNGQLITSSTLNWIPETHYSASKNFVIGGFEILYNSSEDLSQIKKRPIFVCRALHNGIWVAGGQKKGDKQCTVTLTGNICSYERYQLLENVESAARVTWNDWTKFYRPSVGSVATDKLYIARYIVKNTAQNGWRIKQTYYIGTLSSQDTLGTITYVKEDGTEGSTEIGQLLVETEPISYELNAILLNYEKKRIVKKTPRVLGKVTIKNEGARAVKIAKAFGYRYLHTLNWGQGHAMLKGLNTTVTLQNKTRLPDIKWGIDIRENHTNVYTVEVYLEPGTRVNITFYGQFVDVEVPYSGKLFSHYKDTASTDPRIITGIRREERIVDVVPDFGSVYYLSNFNITSATIKNTLKNESTTSMEMLTTQRFVKIISTIINQRQQSNRFDWEKHNLEQFQRKNAIIGEISILNSADQLEESNMQRDQSSSLLLKDKNESLQSEASILLASYFIIPSTTISISLVLLFNRVT